MQVQRYRLRAISAGTPHVVRHAAVLRFFPGKLPALHCKYPQNLLSHVFQPAIRHLDMLHCTHSNLLLALNTCLSSELVSMLGQASACCHVLDVYLMLPGVLISMIGYGRLCSPFCQ